MKPFQFLALALIVVSKSTLAFSATPRMTCSGTMTESEGFQVPLKTDVVLADDPEGYRHKILDFDVSARLTATGWKTINVISTLKRKSRDLGGAEGSGESLSLRVSEKNHGQVIINCKSEN